MRAGEGAPSPPPPPRTFLASARGKRGQRLAAYWKGCRPSSKVAGWACGRDLREGAGPERGGGGGGGAASLHLHSVLVLFTTSAAVSRCRRSANGVVSDAKHFICSMDAAATAAQSKSGGLLQTAGRAGPRWFCRGSVGGAL